MTDEQKQANNLKRIETWKKKKALKAEIEAKKATVASTSPASLEKMHEIQGHVLPKTKIRRDQSVGFKETRLVDEEQLKAAAVARLLLRLKECREDPIKFTEFVMKDPQGRNLVLKDFHKQWLKSFQEDNLVVVEASRNHGKTSILVAYLLWSIGHNPNIRIKLFSQNDARAKERLAEVAANIETNEAFHLVFPEIKPKKGQWSNNRIVVERPMSLKDATLEALGITTSATGGRVDLIALDDVCDLNNSVVYPTVRERIIQKFTGELLPMLDPGGHVVSIATPYHIADLTATLKANPEFKHIRHVVGNDQDPLLPLWPERWDRPALQSLRIQQGAVEFDRAYRCLAFSGETVPCKPEWIKFYTKEELGDPSRMVCIQAYDLAIEQKSTSDYFACVTVLYDMERGKAFVADAKHERLSFSSQGHRIISNFLRWNPDRIIIEKVGLGGSLENYLNENSHIRLPLVPHKPKGDKYFRLMQQLHWLEDDKCTFHPNMDPAKQVLDEDGNLIKELLEFPVGRHDDLVDALTMALFALEEFRNHEAEAGWYDGGSMKAKMSVIG